MRMPDYAKKVKDDKSCWHSITLWADKTEPWIYDVTSNEELERLLAMAPFYNYARAEVLPLAEMETPAFNRLQRKVENAGAVQGSSRAFVCCRSRGEDWVHSAADSRSSGYWTASSTWANACCDLTSESNRASAPALNST